MLKFLRSYGKISQNLNSIFFNDQDFHDSFLLISPGEVTYSVISRTIWCQPPPHEKKMDLKNFFNLYLKVK